MSMILMFEESGWDEPRFLPSNFVDWLSTA